MSYKQTLLLIYCLSLLLSCGSQQAQSQVPAIRSLSGEFRQVAATESVLAVFCSDNNPCVGNQPVGILQGQDGNFASIMYQTGSIFEVSPAGKFTALYCCDVTDTYNEVTQLVQGVDGGYYSTLFQPEYSCGAGTFDCLGLIFKFKNDSFIDVAAMPYQIIEPPMGEPEYISGNMIDSSLVAGTGGRLYGSTQGVGTDVFGYPTDGGLFYVTPPTGAYEAPVIFPTPKGSPYDSGGTILLQASDGTFYGYTIAGGRYGYGYLFEVEPDGSVYQLFSFVDYTYIPSLVEGPGGVFYGVTHSVQTNGYLCQGTDCGVVFSFTPIGPGSARFNLLHSFTGGTSDGSEPFSLVLGSDGNLYGTTVGGGANGYGTAFQVTTAGAFTNLYSFCSQSNCTDGASPTSLMQASDGNLYGNTSVSMFKLSLSPSLEAPLQVIAPSTAKVGEPVTIYFGALNSFSDTMQQCDAFATNQSTNEFFRLGAVAGTSIDGVWVGSFTPTPLSAGTYRVSVTCGGVESGYASVVVSE